MVIQAVRHRIQRKNTVWNRQKHRNKELYRQMKTLLEACYWHFIQWWREKERYFFVYTEKLGIDLNKLEAGNITMDLLSFYYRSRENFEFFFRKIRFFFMNIFVSKNYTNIFVNCVKIENVVFSFNSTAKKRPEWMRCKHEHWTHSFYR